MINGIFVAALTWLKHLPGTHGLVCGQDPEFAGKSLVGADGQKLTGFGFRDATAEGLIQLLKDQYIISPFAKFMAPDLMGAQGLGILVGVEQHPAALGPDQVGCNVFDGAGAHGTRFEVLEPDGVIASAHGIHGEGSQLVIAADGQSPQGEKSVTLGQLIGVDDDLFIGVHAAFSAGINGVVQALFVARVIPVTIQFIGHAFRGRIQARHHLIENCIFQRRRRCHHGFGVGVFLFQVANDLRVFPITHPVVGVDPGVAMNGHGVGPLGSIRRRQGFRQGWSGQQQCEEGQYRYRH